MASWSKKRRTRPMSSTTQSSSKRCNTRRLQIFTRTISAKSGANTMSKVGDIRMTSHSSATTATQYCVCPRNPVKKSKRASKGASSAEMAEATNPSRVKCRHQQLPLQCPLRESKLRSAKRTLIQIKACRKRHQKTASKVTKNSLKQLQFINSQEPHIKIIPMSKIQTRKIPRPMHKRRESNSTWRTTRSRRSTKIWWSIQH